VRHPASKLTERFYFLSFGACIKLAVLVNSPSQAAQNARQTCILFREFHGAEAMKKT